MNDLLAFAPSPESDSENSLEERVAALVPLLLFLLLGCGEPSHSAPEAFSQAVAPGEPSARHSENGGTRMRYRTHVVFDKQANCNALSFLIPEGWTTQGGVVWHHDFFNLACLELTVENPDRTERVSFLQLTPYTWQTQWVVPFPVGSNYLGSIVAEPITNPRTYVERHLLPHWQSDDRPRIVQVIEQPEVAAALIAAHPRDGLSRKTTAAKIRIEYAERGTVWQEDIYCALTSTTMPVGGSSVNWMPERLFSLRAPKGKLDAATPGMLPCVNSVRLELEWFHQYLQVVQLWQQNVMANIRNAGIVSRLISQTSSEISALHRQAYEQQQQSQSRVFTKYSQSIRGVREYRSPYSTYPVTLPQGYRDVWSNPRGEYILSNNAGFDPNVGSTQTWQRLQVEQP